MAARALLSRPQTQVSSRVQQQRRPLRAQAQQAEATEQEFIELDLPKPLGLRFARGNDGGAYVVNNDPKMGNTDPRIQVCVLCAPGGLPSTSGSSGKCKSKDECRQPHVLILLINASTHPPTKLYTPTNQNQPGDKVVQISASFGSDVWDAQNFGQIMYAIRTRNGDVYLKIKRNFGDMSALEVRLRAWL